MSYCYRNQAKRKMPIARSAFMRAEEIDRERAMSGWNPYQGEEETEDMPEQEMEQPWPIRERETEEAQRKMQMPREMENVPNGMQPYFQKPDFSQVLEEQRGEERDLRRLQSMYPETARVLMPYIEEECDKMEYEGSVMFDEYPDRTTVRRIQERVRSQVQEQFPKGDETMPDEMLSMQYQGRGGRRPGRNNWLEDMIQVMLLQEMHHRRCRHRRCQRNR